MSQTKSRITLEVELNEEKIPVDIKWDANTKEGQEACKAFMLSIFERKSKETLKIDLWTKDMQVMEMDRFFFQTLKSMTETYYKATQNQDLARDMHHFVEYFGEKTGIIPTDNKEGEAPKS
jgi:gliding motility-associated protein GldC